MHLSVYAHGTNPKPERKARTPQDGYEESDEDSFGNREHNGSRGDFRGEDYGNRVPKRNAKSRISKIIIK